MKRLLLYCLAACCSLTLKAQLLTWTPAFPKETDNITITVDATKGNQGLMGFTGNVYVHLGAITTLSTGPGDWLHAPFTWGSTDAAALATPAGANKWQFTINNPRTFFSLAAGESLKAIAILFRQGNCTSCLAQRNSDGSDMYVPIYTSALAVRIDVPASQPKYVRVPEPQTWTIGSAVSITANANKPSALKIYHNGVQVAQATAAQTLSASSTVTAYGNQQLIAEANDGTTTTRDTVNIFVSPAASPVAALPAGVRDGINYEPGDTSATLVLRAPGKTRAFVIGDFTGWQQTIGGLMNKTADGKFFWLRIHPLTAGTEYGYQFVVDDTLKVADPYTEKILDPSNDGSITSATYPNLKPYPTGQTTGIVSVLQTAAPAYTWTATGYTRPDKRGLVIYEMLARDFVGTHNWKTIGDSLNYLKKLGINAIELMPVNEFEGNVSWGYNPNFYFAPDKYYGPANTFKAFVDSCHKRGIAVIMDIALNHSFGSSPMVQLYWDAANSRPAANNPWFNPVAKHAYNVGFDMNHESLDTRYYMSRVVEHWLQQYRVDGFRFDLSKGFTQNQTCDNNGNNCNESAMALYDASRVAIWKRYYDTVQAKSPNAYAILEHFAQNTEEIELSNYGMMLWGNLNYNYAQASMGYNTDWDFSYGIYTVRGWTKPHLVTYMESHDEERIVYKNINFGNMSNSSYPVKDTTIALKRMELNAALFFTIPGPKMIWQFGELGYPYSINDCGNGTIDNGCRTSPKPIRWDYLADPRRKSVYDVYSKLINLRFHPWYRDAFITGTIDRSLDGAIKWVKVASGDSSQLLAIGNFDVVNRSGTITFPTAGTWFDYLNNSTFTATGAGQTISLQPGEYHVYVNRNVNNLSTTPVTDIAGTNAAFDVRLYPNPAPLTFTVAVQLPQSDNLEIELYNALGQPVGILYNGFLGRGGHQLELKRKNSAKGLYYLRLKTRSGEKTVPVTLQ